jgi:hypothetical protein
MKLTIKPSLGKLDHMNVRLPAQLKARLDTLRKRAEQQNVDYTATLVAILEDFATELEAKLNPAGIPQASPKNLNGTSSNAKPEDRA